MNDSKLKFLTDKMQAGVTRTNAKGVEEKSTEVQGSLSQTWMADYPLIAYNSYLSDNSQIHLANLAEKQGQKYIIELNEWKFICFVNSVYLHKLLLSQQSEEDGRNELNPLECHIFFLAQHKHR